LKKSIFSPFVRKILSHRGKNRLFQKSFQKNPPEFTPILYMESNRHCVEKKKERNSDALLHAGHDLGLMCFPFFYRIFLPQYKYCMLLVGNQVLWKLQCKFLHFTSTRADVHYAFASFGTTPPTYITLPYPGFEPGTFGSQVGNATN
jgi:hypothetical protein